MMRSRNFAKDYGVLIDRRPAGRDHGRAVVVLDADNKVVYTQLVPEIVEEPNYDAALAGAGLIDGEGRAASARPATASRSDRPAATSTPTNTPC